MGTERTQNPVIGRYRTGGKDWTAAMHPFPYDILDFCEGIGKYSNGMMIISDPGYYQVTASLAVRDNQVEIRVRKNSECCWTRSYSGLVYWNILCSTFKKHQKYPFYLDFQLRL